MKLRKNYLSLSLSVKTTYSNLCVSNLNPEGQDSSCNIDCFMGIYILKLKGAWQAQFLGYTLVTLKNYLFFEDVQMMFL